MSTVEPSDYELPKRVKAKKIIIREAKREDAATLLKLVEALADFEQLPRPDRDARRRFVRDGFGRNRRFRPYLAEIDGRAVAYAIVVDTYSSFLAQPTLYLEDLFVVPSERGKGVGRALFRFFARQALNLGCGRMEWMVLDWNELAIKFYESLGARHLEEWFTFRLTRPELEALADR